MRFLKTLIALLYFCLLYACTDTSEKLNTCSIDINEFEHDYDLNEKVKTDLAEKELFGKILFEGEEGFEFSLYGNDQKTVVHNGVIYSRYWQLKDKKAYVLHPMVFGRYVFNNSDSLSKNEDFKKAINSISYSLPGTKSKAFYYPDYYPLNRMSGPDLMYSAISQSEILAGVIKVEQKNSNYRLLVDSIKEALLLDYYKGGVNLSNKALLEIPLFRSSPEIILNGWLHALLHLNDYCRIYNDTNAINILNSNISFLSENISDWYNDDLKISSYSNTTPYHLKINMLTSSFPNQAIVNYTSLVDGLKNQKVTLNVDDTSHYGAYDNHLRNVKDSSANVYVTFSSMFDTKLILCEEFNIEFNVGEYIPLKSTPNLKGEKIKLQSVYDEKNKYHYIDFNLIKDKLFLGYPTNFNKANGKNYYHVQHILAMLYIAHYSPYINEDDKKKLIETSKSWYYNTLDYKQMDISRFEKPQKVLDGILRGKVIIDTDQASELFEMSGIEEKW